MKGRLSLIPAALLILVVCGLLFSQTRTFGLLGWDTYPIILTSRVLSFEDALGNFTERLMDGRYQSAFYRPVLNWTFALDYALWGLEPLGYQLTSLLLFAACAAAIWWLAVRASRGALAPLLALAFFLLHASHFEVLPVPSRRADTMACLFMALALAAQLSPSAWSRRLPPLLPALFALLAYGSKETTFVLPVLLLVAMLLSSPAQGRLRHVAWAFVPHVVILAVAFAARWAVLGGLGGHPQTSMVLGALRFPWYLSVMAVRVLFPQQEMVDAPWGRWLVAALAVSLVCAGLLRIIRRARIRSDGAVTPLRLGLLGLAWLFVLAAIYAVAGQLPPWYTLMSVAGFAMVLGAGAEGLLLMARTTRGATRTVGAFCFVPLILYLVWQASFSPLFHHYDEWERATGISDAYLAELKRRVDSVPDGTVLQSPPVPYWLQKSERTVQIYGAAVVAKRSIQAWLELTYPQRRILVILGALPPNLRPYPDVVIVQITQGVPGWIAPPVKGFAPESR